MYDKLCQIITEQQKKVKDSPAFYVGEQLKDIAKDNGFITDLLINDLTKDGMSIVDAEKQIKKYADGKKKNQSCVCVTPSEADDVLRKFYGLPAKEEVEGKKTIDSSADDSFIDLNEFLFGGDRNG